uniref:Uncharacterized protein n=1 Tax=Glossina palpalis gambiensis TaxID=67801 RepID=A0A1B0ANT0_9MUSC
MVMCVKAKPSTICGASNNHTYMLCAYNFTKLLLHPSSTPALSILIQSFYFQFISHSQLYCTPSFYYYRERMQYRVFPITIDNLYSLRYSSNGNISKMHHQNMKRKEAKIWTCWLQNCTYFTAVA